MKYIIISGGELYNKGAQAMSFICVDEIAKRWPEYKVVLLSALDFKRNSEEKSNYKFDILSQPSVKDNLILRMGKIACFYAKVFHKNRILEWIKVYNNSVLWLDISGYGLGSYWKPARNIQYMLNIANAKCRKIPVYLLPQSFGPFEFCGMQGFIADKFINHYISSIKLAMARENEGEMLLKKQYHLKQVIKTDDMVLQNKKINYSNIFYEIPSSVPKNIKNNSVAIIPNIRNNKYGKDKMMELYKCVVDFLLKKGFNVSIIYHAIEDRDVCKDIKKMYDDDARVYLIEQEITGIEMDIVMSQYLFVIASRFHSIVHSYKSFVPAMVFGWATKYTELLNDFEQTKYLFDVRNSINQEDVIVALNELSVNYKLESRRIKDHLTDIQNKNIFDFIEL